MDVNNHNSMNKNNTSDNYYEWVYVTQDYIVTASSYVTSG